MPRLRQEVAVSHLAGILAGAGATMLGPVLPALCRIWPASDADAGWWLACEFAGGCCGAAASGWLGARLALTKLLAAGLALLAMGWAGAALLQKPWLPWFLFGCGLGLGFINPMANLIVSRAYLPSPTAALNLFNFSWAVGALATPSAIAWLLRHQGISPVLAELAVPAAAAAVLAAACGRGNGWKMEAETSSTGAETSVATGWFIGITGAILFLYVGVETSVSVWLPTGAARWAGLSAEVSAAAQSVFWTALLMGRLLAPVLLRHLAPRRLILAGLMCGAAGTVLVVTGFASPVLFCGAFLAGFGLAPVNPTVVAAFTTRLGRLAARWTGPVFAAAGLGGAAIPWLVGEISSHLGSLRAGFLAPLSALGGMLLLEIGLGSRELTGPPPADKINRFT